MTSLLLETDQFYKDVKVSLSSVAPSPDSSYIHIIKNT